MRVFLSYPAKDRKLAERLRDELSRDGLSVSTFDVRDMAGVEWQKQIEDAIRSADDILVLVGPKSNDDAAQQVEWQAALKAVWKDSRKRLIPILLRNAALPPFVFGDACGPETKVVRIVDPRDVRSAAEAIWMALQRGSHEPRRSGIGDPKLTLASRGPRGGGTDPGLKSGYPLEGKLPVPQADDSTGSGSVEVGTKASYSVQAEEAWHDRVLEIKKIAERLKD